VIYDYIQLSFIYIFIYIFFEWKATHPSSPFTTSDDVYSCSICDATVARERSDVYVIFVKNFYL